MERVAVIKFRIDNEGGNSAGCFGVEIWADTAKFTNVIVAVFRKCRDLVRESKVFIKNKAKVCPCFCLFVCLSVSLSVSKITQKGAHVFG